MSCLVLKKIAVGIALVGAACSVWASPTRTFDLGDLSVTRAIADIEIAGSFDDIFKFKLGSFTGAVGSIVGLDLNGDLTASYRFGFGEGVPTWFSDFPAPELVPSDADGLFSYMASANGLTPGQTYWVNIQGSATEAAYSVTLAPVSVPEPGSAVLMLSAIGLMGFSSRRRSPK